jgi:hypothetical protein
VTNQTSLDAVTLSATRSFERGHHRAGHVAHWRHGGPGEGKVGMLYFGFPHLVSTRVACVLVTTISRT